MPKTTGWRGLLAPIGRRTGDGRRFLNDSLSNRDLPLPFRWTREAGKGHEGAVTLGTTTKVEFRDGELRRPDGTVETVFGAWGEGTLFDPDPATMPRLAEDVAEFRLLAEQRVLGPSVDLDDMEYTVDAAQAAAHASGSTTKPPEVDVTKGRISAATAVPIAAYAETAPAFELFDLDDEPAEVASAGLEALPVVDEPWDAGSAVERLREWAGEDSEIYGQAFLWSDGTGEFSGYKFPVADVVDGQIVLVREAVDEAFARLPAAALTEPDRKKIHAALARLRKTLTGDCGDCNDAVHGTEAGDHALVAGAAPLRPRRAAFERPEATALTPLTFTDDGEVFGHLADWTQCHVGYAACKQPPRSRTGYAYFHSGEVVTAEGDVVAVGRLTVGNGHADTSWSYRPAMAHYDDTTRQVAIGRASDGRHGIWFSGTLVPEADEHQVAELRRSSISPDWRRIGGHLEMIAAHGVNSGGLPMVREHVTAGRTFALVASGGVPVNVEPARLDPQAIADAAAARALDEFAAREKRRRRAVAAMDGYAASLGLAESTAIGRRALNAAHDLAVQAADDAAERELAALLARISDEEFVEYAELAEPEPDGPPWEYGSRFDAMVSKLSGKVGNPRAVAAAIGRRKYGKEGFRRLRNVTPEQRAKMHRAADREHALVTDVEGEFKFNPRQARDKDGQWTRGPLGAIKRAVDRQLDRSIARMDRSVERDLEKRRAENVRVAQTEGPELHGFGEKFEGRTVGRIAAEYHKGKHKWDDLPRPVKEWIERTRKQAS